MGCIGTYGCKDTTLSETVSDFFQKVINRVIHSAVTLPFPLGGLYYEGDMLTVLHRVALLPDSRNATVSRSKPLLMYSETNEEKEKC